MESMTLWFQPGSRREGLYWVSTHENRMVTLCRHWNCELCNLSERERLRGFRGGKLEVKLTLHRKPSFWETSEYYLGHLVSIPEREEAGADEGLEFDISKCNTIVLTAPQGAILIDPGSMGFSGESPLRQLVAGQRVLATIVSHGHLDHWKDLGEIRSPVFMTRLAFLLASRHAHLQRDFQMARALREAKMATPGQPIFLEKPPLEIGTIWLPHSIPETMGLVIKGSRQRVVYLGDFRLNGWEGKTKAQTIAAFQEIAKGGVDLLALTIFNAHMEGFTPIETLVIDALTNVLVRTSKRVLVTGFSTNHGRIQRIAQVAQILDRPVAFYGAGMRNSQELLGIPAEEGAIDSENAVVFVTGSQAEEFSVLWRIAQGQNPAFELRATDTLVFSSRCISNEVGLRTLIRDLRSQVDRVIVHEGEIEKIALGCLGVEETLTHVPGHGNREDLRLALEILRPKRVLPWPQTSPQIEAFRELAKPLGIEILPETERIIEV